MLFRSFLREREKVKWTTALAGGAAVLAVLYFVFERGLGIDLYPGVATQAALDFLFPIE